MSIKTQSEAWIDETQKQFYRNHWLKHLIAQFKKIFQTAFLSTVNLLDSTDFYKDH